MSEDIVGQIKDIKGRTWQEAFYIQTKAFLEKNSEHIKEIERLKAENERLTPLLGDIVSFDEYHKLLQQVERLTKAGDAMVDMVDWEVPYERRKKLEADWNAAKEGKPRA